MKRIVGLVLVLVLLCSAFGASAEILKRGSQGTLVRALQEKMKELKYYQGPIDGVYGKALYEAVWRLQKDVGLKTDGIAGPITLGRLGLKSIPNTPAGPTVPAKGLTVGATGSAVISLQTALRKLGYYGGSSTGKYDDALWTAVWQFQRDKGFATTGVADAQVLAALGIGGGAAVVSIGSLSHGATGAAVRSLQVALQKAGYYQGAIDGVFGDSTYTAVWRYQRDKGLSPNGVANAQVLSLLGVSGTATIPSGASLSMGSTGAAVRTLQTALKNLGYYTIAVDGDYGYQTYLAVYNYQRAVGLSPDGIAGPQTLTLLNVGGVVPSSGGVPTTQTLKHGSKGDAVRALQSALKNLNYYTGTVDGNYGDSTFTAVWWLQKNNKLPVTGIADINTIAVVNSGFAVAK